jgi:segregation and condensation protein B
MSSPGKNDPSKRKALEALLFAAPGPSSLEQLSRALDMSETKVENLINDLTAHFNDEHGLRIQKNHNQYQLVTAAEYGQLIETFLGLEVTTRLTQAALEALAIIAYKQPATRPEIDAIRGVNSDYVVRSLLSKGLIEELGRSEAPGRPILYGVTPDFLQYFGLSSIDELPEVNLDDLVQKVQEDFVKEERVLKD